LLKRELNRERDFTLRWEEELAQDRVSTTPIIRVRRTTKPNEKKPLKKSFWNKRWYGSTKPTTEKIELSESRYTFFNENCVKNMLKYVN